MFEGGVMIPPNAHDRAEVNGIYHETIKADPSREVAIYRNPVTGEHILVFGDKGEGFIETKRGGVTVREAPMPGGSSRKQEFKDFLPADVGHWELEAHYHPTQVGMHDEAPMQRRLPSAGAEGKGDFGALKWESRRGGGQARESVIHFFDQGRTVETVFGFDPKARNGEVYSVNVENPATGKRETHRFVDIPAYEKWASQFDAKPSADLAKGSGGTPATREARPDESITLRHGTSEAHAAAIEAGGIDPHRASGESDDFGRGFYTTLDEPNAAAYGRRGADDAGELTAAGKPGAGRVIKAEVKLSELGDVVDVRPGGEHFEAWQEFLDRKPRAFPPPLSPALAALDPWPTAREYGLGNERARKTTLQRGAVFEAFLHEQGLTQADAIRGPLLSDDWTSGHGAGPGEQIVVRSRRLANMLNERMGFPLVPDEPAAPRTREGGGTAREGETPAHPAARGGAPELIQDLPGQGHDHPAIRGLPDPFPEWQEPKREPFAGPETPEEAAARQRVSREVDEKGIQAFMAARKDELQALRGLSPEADQVVMRAVRDNANPREFHEAALREVLAKEGLPQKAIDAHAQTLREFLTPVGRQLDEFRAAVMDETLIPDEVQKWKDRDAAGKPNKVSLNRRKAEVIAAFAKSLTERDAQGRLTRASVGDFIDAAREFEAWKGKVARLNVDAPAALPRQVDVDALQAFRDLDETKEEHKDRDALKRLDSTPETKALATEILIKATGDPSQLGDLLIDWGRTRKDSPRLAGELADLATVLSAPEDPAGSRSELVRRLQEARLAQSDLKISSQNVEAMALADPILLQLAATNREQFIERYVAMMRDEKYRGRALDTAAFRADVDKAVRGGEGSLSTASEAAATFHVAERMGLEVIKSESTNPTGRTNESGIDVVAFKQRTDAEYLWQEPVAVHLFDDKAVRNPLIGDVTALTDNLADNLDKAVAKAREGVANNYPGGRQFNPDFEPALKQM
ncbi:MAG TPA: hypothetical protein VN671_02685, partial [Solirubrobacterales bacterium]|nr:hypothetical protein [Solirubrobacterales bacterium]